MATADGLIGVGVAPETAIRTGWTVLSVTTSGTTQGSGTGVLKGAGNKIVLATPHAGDGAITLPSGAQIGDEFWIYNAHASNDLSVFPPSGGTILNISQNAAVLVEDNQSVRIVKVTATTWLSRLALEPVAT